MRWSSRSRASSPALGAAVACAHPPAPGRTSAPVMTYNIRSGNGDLAGTTEQAILASAPDVVALQEVDVHWADRSKFVDQAAARGQENSVDAGSLCAHSALLCGSAPTGSARALFGVALLSKFPIIDWSNHIITRLSTRNKSVPGRRCTVFSRQGSM